MPAKKIIVRYESLDEEADIDQVIIYLAKRFKTNAPTIKEFLKKPKSKMRVVDSREKADAEIARLQQYGIIASYDGQFSQQGKKAQFDDDEDDVDSHMITCPKCGVYQQKGTSCISCKVTFEKYGRGRPVTSANTEYPKQEDEKEKDDKPDYGFKLGEIQGLVTMMQIAGLLALGFFIMKFLD